MNAETRRRLADPACPMDYPVLADLRAEGATDYVAVPLRFLSEKSTSLRSPAAVREDSGMRSRRAAHRPALLHAVVEIYGLMRKARNILDAISVPTPAPSTGWPDQARRRRGHPRGDLVLRPARLHCASPTR